VLNLTHFTQTVHPIFCINLIQEYMLESNANVM